MAHHIGSPLITIPGIRQELLRIKQDGGLVEGKASCYFNDLKQILPLDPSIVIVPNATKAGKLYGIKGTDLNVVRATTATRVNNAGLIEEVAINVPRLDYTNGSCPSILVEPQRTNLVLRSEEFDNAAWTKTNATISANVAISPSGNQDSDKLVPNTSNASHSVSTSGQAITGRIYSVFAKADGYDFILLTSHLSVAPEARGAFFNVSDGTIGTTAAGVNAKIEDYGNGWYRCSINEGNAPSSIWTVMATNADNVITFAGNGTDGVLIWGGQNEVGLNATSYIPTVASSVTRNAEVISKTGLTGVTRITETFEDGSTNQRLVSTSYTIPEGRIKRVVGELENDIFAMVVQSDNAGTSGTDQFTIPTSGAGYLYDIETSDGYVATGITGNHTITFLSGAGTRTVFISGDFPRIFFNNVGDKLKVLEVTNWGNYGVSQADQSGAFRGCTNLTSIADNGAWFDVVTNGGTMFRDASLTLIPSEMNLPLLTNGDGMFVNNSITSLPSGMELPLLTTGVSMFNSNSLTSLPAGMELPLLTNGTLMFSGNTINTTRYSQLLVDLESGNANNNVPFHGGNSKYNATGETARDILTGATRLWTIIDGGLE